MCCFSPVSLPAWRRLFSFPFSAPIKVSGTNIYARLAGEEQFLAYSMSVSTPAAVAMVLPLPVKPGLGEAALEFIDLAGLPKLFEILESLMSPFTLLPASRSQGFGLSLSLPTLVVHKVGSFEASFVPSQKDFGRLDPRFRLPPSVWDALPGVRDYGFAVFQLAKGRKKTIHPMAFRFVTRDPGALFFPTVHVHDGRVHADAKFDHSLYYQGVDTDDPSSAMEVTEDTAERAKGLLVPGHLRRRRLNGKLPNRDTWIETRREARAA